MINHLILVKIENGHLVAWQYLASKFDRQLGDVVNYDGVAMNVGVIGDTKNGVLHAIDDLVRKQNAIIRRINNQQRYKQTNNIVDFINSIR